MAKDRVKIGLRLDPNVYSGGWHIKLIPAFENKKDTTLEDWQMALAKVWDVIDEIIQSGNLTRGNLQAPKKSYIRQHTKLKWKVFARDNYTCQRCGIREDLEVDHIRPVSKGGRDSLKNLQTLCKRCNVKKGNKWHPHRSKEAIPA